MDWVWLDPVIGVVGAVVIARWSWGLIRDAGAVLLDTVPDETLANTIREKLEVDGDRVADLPLRRVGPGHSALIAAIVADRPQSPKVYKERLASLPACRTSRSRCVSAPTLRGERFARIADPRRRISHRSSALNSGGGIERIVGLCRDPRLDAAGGHPAARHFLQGDSRIDAGARQDGSCFLCHGLAPGFLTRGLAVAGTLASVHVLSAVVLAFSAAWLVTRTLGGAGRAPALENISRGMLIVIGLWLLFRAVRRQSHLHGEGLMVGVIAGLIPCPLTLFAMFLALSRGVPEAGLPTFAAAMMFGVAFTLGAVADDPGAKLDAKSHRPARRLGRAHFARARWAEWIVTSSDWCAAVSVLSDRTRKLLPRASALGTKRTCGPAAKIPWPFLTFNIKQDRRRATQTHS